MLQPGINMLNNNKKAIKVKQSDVVCQVLSKVIKNLEARKSEELVLSRLQDLRQRLKPAVWKK